MALGCCVLIGSAIAGGFDTNSTAVAKRMKKSFAIRTAETCAPVAPIETRLAFANTPRLGEPAVINFEVVSLEKGVDATVRFDIPAGVGVQGSRTETGTLEKERGYQFSRSIVFERPGRYVIAAQAIAGIPEYRFGRRNTLYVEVDGRGIRYSETPFETLDSGGPTPAPLFAGRNEPKKIFGTNQSTLPQTEIPKVDGNGKPLDGGEGYGTDANATVYGYWRYRHTDNTLHEGYGTAAEAWDQDDFSGDDFLGSVAVGTDGYWEITFDNNSDGGVEPGTADVYITFASNNSEVQVHNAADDQYRTSTAVLFPNIGGGSHNAGSWYADWGTNGVSDSNERAFQLEDSLTRAWSFGVGVGHNAHKTFCEWYVGSTDGAYYRRSEDRIYIHDATLPSIDVIRHEYGHSFHDSFNGEGDWPPGAGGSHTLTGHFTDGLALTEGYGTYFSCASQGDDRWYDDLDPGNSIHFDCEANWDGNGAANGNADNLSNNPNWGYDTESAVLSMLLDIDDTNNAPTDPYDWSSFGADEIHDIFFNYLVSGHHLYSVRDFYAGWYDQNHPYRPKMNGQMMVHGMKQGIDRGALGVYDGINIWAGTWYFGGYGRGSFFVKNYGSQNYALNQLYVWVTDPSGADVPGFGGDGNNAVIASGATREIWKPWNQVGLNGSGTVVADPRYGSYRIRAGHYRSDGAWQLLEPAEAGTDRDINVNVVEDTTAPTVTSFDDGDYQFSRTSVHLRANAVEGESSIRSFWVRLGSTPGGGDILAWTEYLQNDDPSFDEVVTFPQVAYGTTVYATIVARNIELLDGFSETNGIQVVNPERVPTSFVKIRGTITGGNNIAAVQNSDDTKMLIQPGVIFSSGQSPVDVEFSGTAPLMPLSTITLKVESSASSTNIRLYIEMYDYDANAWVLVHEGQSTTGDTTYSIARNDWDRWIGPAGQIRCKVRYKANGAVFGFPWTARIDWIHWTLSN
jgi:hypothetical protein